MCQFVCVILVGIMILVFDLLVMYLMRVCWIIGIFRMPSLAAGLRIGFLIELGRKTLLSLADFVGGLLQPSRQWRRKGVSVTVA
jgi:hypothetical protein